MPLSRRTFLGSTALAATALPHLARGLTDPARPLRTAVIGCGWFGLVVLKAFRGAGSVNCVAICDVDSARLEEFATHAETLQGSRPRFFKHYQELLDQTELDFVIIATPPQWHALPFIAACARKLPIYCEKPLAYDVREGQAMVAAAEKAGVPVQIGFQRRSNATILEARQFIQEGGAGEIVQVEAQIHYQANPPSHLPVPPPATLDWDLWCGPAPLLPYAPNIGHLAWRLEHHYGHGHLVDWGIHLIDSIRFTLGLGAPDRVQGAGGLYRLKERITTPDILQAQFDFGSLPVSWRHRLWGAAEFHPDLRNCILYYGDQATVFVSDSKWIVYPREKGAAPIVHEPAAKTDAGVVHAADFLQALTESRPPVCPVDDGHLSTTAVQLAMIAYETGSAIAWDAARATISGHPAAAALLQRPYRAPYIHPFA